MDTGEFRFNEEGILFYFGAPTMLLNIRSIVSLQRDLEEKEVAEETLRDMGRRQTRRAMKRYEDRYNFDEMARNEIMSFVDDLTDVLALGEFEMHNLDPKDEGFHAVVNNSNPIARIYRKEYGEAEESKDYFLQGLFEAGLSSVREEDFKVEEKECMAKGDERCLFVFKTKD